jgi:sterol desaturase/sphingolipid hydroxylase (fatty acid hydroxylase superfamily)
VEDRSHDSRHLDHRSPSPQNVSVPPLSLADVQALAIVAAVLGVAVWERLSPNTSSSRSSKRSVTANIGLLAINTVLVAGPAFYFVNRFWQAPLLSATATLPLGDVGTALQFLWWFLALDLTSYFLHRAFHAVPLLYRLHCAHHSDRDVDLTTAFRRHPIEFLLNAVVTCGVGLAVGAPLEAIGIYGLIATVLQIWHHGNLAVAASVERAIGWLLVTPALHRSHHAVDFEAANCNYGTVLSVWDRIFRTASRAPEPKEFGVRGLEGPDHQSLKMVLLSPILVDPRYKKN